jgi:hypothetical protein
MDALLARVNSYFKGPGNPPNVDLGQSTKLHGWLALMRVKSLLAGPLVIVVVTVTTPETGADGAMVAVVPAVLATPLDFHSVRSVDHS